MSWRSHGKESLVSCKCLFTWRGKANSTAYLQLQLFFSLKKELQLLLFAALCFDGVIHQFATHLCRQLSSGWRSTAWSYSRFEVSIGTEQLHMLWTAVSSSRRVWNLLKCKGLPVPECTGPFVDDASPFVTGGSSDLLHTPEYPCTECTPGGSNVKRKKSSNQECSSRVVMYSFVVKGNSGSLFSPGSACHVGGLLQGESALRLWVVSLDSLCVERQRPNAYE
jgi:hypothetical protein